MFAKHFPKPIFYLFFFAVLGFTSCTKDDTSPPTITLIDVVDFEKEVTVGERLQTSVKFEDNDDLGAYEINIHNAFDGHTHGKTETSPYYKRLTGELAGKSQTVNIDELIPADAATGPYHIEINVTDRKGNAGETVEIELTIEGGSMPVISNLKADGVAVTGDLELNFTASETTKTTLLTADINDADGLDSVKVFVAAEEGADAGKKVFTWAAKSTTGTAYNLNTTINWDKAKLINDTHYIVHLVARDNQGNYALKEFSYHVTK